MPGVSAQPVREGASAWAYLSDSGRAVQQRLGSTGWRLPVVGRLRSVEWRGLALLAGSVSVLRADRSLHDRCQLVCVDALAYVANRAFAEECPDAFVRFVAGEHDHRGVW